MNQACSRGGLHCCEDVVQGMQEQRLTNGGPLRIADLETDCRPTVDKDIRRNTAEEKARREGGVRGEGTEREETRRQSGRKDKARREDRARRGRDGAERHRPISATNDPASPTLGPESATFNRMSANPGPNSAIRCGAESAHNWCKFNRLQPDSTQFGPPRAAEQRVSWNKYRVGRRSSSSATQQSPWTASSS